MPRPFKSEKVIEEKISDATLKAYHIGFEDNKFRLNPLVDILMRAITEFAFGYHEGISIPHTEIIEKVREAADVIYQTDKYQKRGEFGELILHVLLRDFHQTIPLISKIYFKDSQNATVHGFDAVQITMGNEYKKLWLGESKLYKDGSAGIDELVNDIEHHVQSDFLRKEFQLLYKKLPNQIPDTEYWRNLMDKHTKLEDIFQNIVIPMVCTYSSSVFQTHKEASKAFFNDFTQECQSLYTRFSSKNIKTNVEILLLLLPVPCKDELNTALDRKLKAFQL